MSKSKLEQDFLYLIMGSNLPKPVAEYRFHPSRRWRFDYAWIDRKVAVEIDGGCFSFGRHNRGVGFTEDTIKFNAAVLLGWRVLHYTGTTMNNSIEDLKKILIN